MTRAELNTSIDTVFDDNRAVDSLTPSMEGTELKKVADYVDQEIAAVSIGGKTNGVVIASLSAPYPVLTFNLNTVNSNYINDTVVLPTTTEIGKEILVFAGNNPSAFRVQANQANTAGISAGGISSTSSSLNIGANISVRFIHLNNGYWKAEII
jgi:hypothetical protein